jgi:hypothetical protein
MINNRGITRAGTAMLACGTAAMLALAGCSTQDSGSQAVGAGGHHGQRGRRGGV